MPELAVLNDGGWEITRCWDFEETDSALILFNGDEERKGWIPKREVGRIIPVEEHEDDD
jgi:carotenoid cleavage dioxygenase-like enzyme